MSNPRKAAAEILLKTERDGAYSNITLSSYCERERFTREDKALLSALVYGVLDRKIALDYVLGDLMRSPLKKTAPFTLQVLRTALFQIMYMDRIPDSAAVNEAVKLIKASGEKRNAGFVNGVLRAVLRNGISLPEDDTPKSMSVRYSCPEHIISGFISDYGLGTARLLLEESLRTPPMTLRVNTVKTDTEALLRDLTDNGINVCRGQAENSLTVPCGMDVRSSNAYRDGLFFVQDTASSLAVSALAPKSGERVLDMCAAPGGKSFTAALLMENTGDIVSCDIYEKRVELISASAKRLGLDIIKPIACDASKYNGDLGKFDCIICDVPCSGLGVIRRKPEIKYKAEQNFNELEELQFRILCNAVKYLKNGGRILYSTCTLRKAENEGLVIRFLKEYNSFCKTNEKCLMPHIDKTDGFYYALLEHCVS